MSGNPVIYNTGGAHRFLDYVSFLPEFLREETDVVTLMRVFSDYLNNAYRNTRTATRFEVKLIAIEGMLGTISAELQVLADLFSKSEARELPLLYLFKPKNPAGTIVDYHGTELIPDISIIPGIASINDRIYVNMMNYPDRSGVYVVVAGNKLTLDPNGSSQDPFSNTPDKPILTSVGYAPRMIQFYPSDVSAIQYRKLSDVGGIIYYEVFFEASIVDITDVPSIDKYDFALTVPTVSKHKYLIDYYNYMGSTFPSEYDGGKLHLTFDTCNPFDLASPRGVFYSRDLTLHDTRSDVIASNGENIYIDPSFSYHPADTAHPLIPSNQLFFNRLMDDPSSSMLTFFTNYIEPGYFSLSDGKVYLSRLILDFSANVNLSSIDLLDNAITVSDASKFKIGHIVQFKSNIGAVIPYGILDDSTHTVSLVDYVHNKIYLAGVDLVTPGSGTATVTRYIRSKYDVAIVDSVSTSGAFTKITLSSYSGDFITQGEIGIIIGNKLTYRTRILSDVRVWNNYTQYNMGSYVYYNNRRYRVLISVDPTLVYGTPDTELLNYVIDMGTFTFNGEVVGSISSPVNVLEYNPYMFGSYTGKYIPYGANLDFNLVNFSDISDDIIIQQTENVGIAFKYPQREWIFNPISASASTVSRNGWFEIFKSQGTVHGASIQFRDDDIANPLAAQFENIPVEISRNDDVITVRFISDHYWEIGSYIRVSGASPDIFVNGEFPILSIIDSKTISYKVDGNIVPGTGHITGNIRVKSIDKISNNTIIYSNVNLFTVTANNPYICESGNFYKYTCKEVEWSKHTNSNPVSIKYPTGNVADSYKITHTVTGSNVYPLYGEHGVYKYDELVLLQYQNNSSENGYWRVQRDNTWKRVGDKVTMKVRDLYIDSIVVDDLINSDDPYYYTRHSSSDVDFDIMGSVNVFKAPSACIGNFSMELPVIEGIDTTVSAHRLYDARNDSNSVADIPTGFKGIPDMKYPILEKIERLVYLRDPNVIDYVDVEESENLMIAMYVEDVDKEREKMLLPIKHTTHITGNVTEDTHGYIVLVTEYDCD